VARELSLPVNKNEFKGDYVRSYRIRNGVLHNPVSDRRTTKGLFHVTEGGLPIPGDKKAVPKAVFAHLLREAFTRRNICSTYRSPPGSRRKRRCSFHCCCAR